MANRKTGTTRSKSPRRTPKASRKTTSQNAKSVRRSAGSRRSATRKNVVPRRPSNASPIGKAAQTERSPAKRGAAQGNGGSRTLTDPAEIRRWVERYEGRPTKILSDTSKNEPTILRIRFPGYSSEEMLQEISWSEFFRLLDENKWAFRYYEMIEGERDYPRCEIYQL